MSETTDTPTDSEGCIVVPFGVPSETERKRRKRNEAIIDERIEKKKRGDTTSLLERLRKLPRSPSVTADVVPILRELAAALEGSTRLAAAAAREDAVSALKALGVASPARVVDAALTGEGEEAPGRVAVETLEDTQPCANAVVGAEVLDTLARTVARFVRLPEGATAAVALWTLGTYVYDDFAIYPRLCAQSAEKRSGKSTLLEVLRLLVRRALLAQNMSDSVLFRVVDQAAPTLLLDEGDRWLADERKRPELVGLLNSGHRRGGAVWRCVGDDFEPKAFAVYCPVAIALIGRLPDTLADRSVMLRMKRKPSTEQVERLRLDRTPWAEELRAECARWALDNRSQLRDADPDVPVKLHDRAADNWRALLAIADLVGGRWPVVARKAALLLSGAEESEQTVTELLLSDIRDVFDKTSGESLRSRYLVEALHALEERPWGEWGRSERPITPIQLARQLKRFDVRPKPIREGEGVDKGYRRADFEDAWSRYLPPSAPSSDSDRLHGYNVGAARVCGDPERLHEEDPVTGQKSRKPLQDNGCNRVTGRNAVKGEEGGYRPSYDRKEEPGVDPDDEEVVQ